MHTDALLQIAREIVNNVPACMAITVDRHGDANARVVYPTPLSDTWTVRFKTDRRSRKSAKIAGWDALADKWFPGGPTDPNVVYVDFTAERIELWSTPQDVVPDPLRGLWAAVVARRESGWIQRTTLPKWPVAVVGMAEKREASR